MNQARLYGKKALVTAAANGIGRHTAMMFAREGAQVLATDIDRESLDGLTRESGAITATTLDVTDRDGIKRVVESRQFDIVANCAGWVHHGNIEACDEHAWRQSFAVNVDSMYWICRAVIPGMLSARGGSIVNISSVVSSLRSAPNRFAYATTKAAVIGLTKAIAADYAPFNVRCNAICPGTILTPSLKQRIAALGGSEEEHWKKFAARQPVGRLGTPDEVAALIVHLASNESSFTTGSVYTIDGGWS